MSNRPFLALVQQPGGLASLAEEDLPRLAAEIREELLEVVSCNGGHLASNLGAVELTIALLRAYDAQKDVVVWDTGHQGYVWKMLTGRRELVRKLRQPDGCCGFLHRQESAADHFGAGHAGTAISAALGFAVARDRDRGAQRVVAVVGDAALSCGSSLEGLNSIAEATQDFVLLVNDNKMSISKNVGALSRHLNRLIANERYNRIKVKVRRSVGKLPVIGKPLQALIHQTEAVVKRFMLGAGAVFEELGMRYMGPFDGHDVVGLAKVFAKVRQLHGPIVIHVLTEKGKGFAAAEREPERFHGVSPFPLDKEPAAGGDQAYASYLGRWLAGRCPSDRWLMAISAGMCSGTGLNLLRQNAPHQLIDVGIAEEHAVVFAAGLAAAGYRPLVAIYASFMQRAMDYVFHDVCLQRLPVIFCLDRAGIVEDGPTHHGIHDIGFWLHLPGLAVLQPSDGAELEAMLTLLREREDPAVVRYPRGDASPLPVQNRPPIFWGRAESLRPGRDVAIWAAGRETAIALEVAALLEKEGVDAKIVNPRFLTPFDAEHFLADAQAMPVVTLENHVLPGGLAIRADALLAQFSGHRGILHLGWPNEIQHWGSEEFLRQSAGLDKFGVTRTILNWLGKSK